MPKRTIMTPRERKPLDLETYEGRFAQRLKALREKAKLSVEELATILGVSPHAVYYWESGRRQPKISDLPKIAEVLSMKKAKDLLPNE